MRDRTSSLRKALSILDAFNEHDTGVSMLELSRRTNFPKSTTHRLVTDLVSWGGIERTPGGLRIGLRLFERGQLARSVSLREIARPYLEDLRQATNKTVNLAVRDGTDVVYVEKLIGRSSRASQSRAGGRLPLHCTAMGKAILAFSNESLVKEMLQEPLRPMTESTITNPVALRTELAMIRRDRVAFDSEESVRGIICVASPLMSSDGVVIGAVSITGFESIVDCRKVTTALLTASFSLSRRLVRFPAETMQKLPGD